MVQHSYVSRNYPRVSKSSGCKAGMQRKSDASVGIIFRTHSALIGKFTSRWSQGLDWCASSPRDCAFWEHSWGDVTSDVPRHTCPTDQLDKWSKRGKHSILKPRREVLLILRLPSCAINKVLHCAYKESVQVL